MDLEENGYVQKRIRFFMGLNTTVQRNFLGRILNY